MKKVVIAGSSSLQNKFLYRKDIWEKKWYNVTNYPVPISKEGFLKEYPEVHKTFFKDIIEADILFIMNEDKNWVIGYIGAESFAEMSFGINQNLINNKSLEVILLKMPEVKVQSYEEINLWLQLNWIKLYND